MTAGPMPDLPDFCWPVDVSCVPDWDAWDVEPDPEADPPVEGVPTYSPEDKARAIAMAGQTLRYLTGFRVGGCPITVRPCSRRCSESTWRTFPVAGAGSAPWIPVSIGGSWLNITCGCATSCSCSRLCEVRLNGPVGAVEEVKVDGMVLDASAYRLDGDRLVRTDGDCWPVCQDLSSPDSAEGTWSVTYTPGLPVDGLGAWVAGILAGEYVKACTGGDCRLPQGVIAVARDGVTMRFDGGVFPNNQTGIREVDNWVARYNPNGLRAPAVVWSPDVSRPRTQGV